MNKIVLVIAAHSDDDALGCSGTMAKHIASGDVVHILYMTDGVSSRNDDSNAVERYSLAQKVAGILNIASMKNLTFPDNKMDSVPLLDVTQAIETVVSEIQPEIIYTHHIGDLNIDHQITHKAVMTACRPQPLFCVKEIYSFEVLSSTEWQLTSEPFFVPNVFVDISDFISVKKKVLEVYEGEMRLPPHSRNIENAVRLSAVRGNSVGYTYAEAFVLNRYLKE